MSACILVVDDEPLLRSTLERSLIHLGYDVRCAADAHSAYTILSECQIDAVLLDIRMPLLAGDEFYIAIIRRWPELRGRVVLMSGDFWSIRDSWPDELRACPTLGKPFTIEMMASTVSAVLTDRSRQPRRATGG